MISEYNLPTTKYQVFDNILKGDDKMKMEHSTTDTAVVVRILS